SERAAGGSLERQVVALLGLRCTAARQHAAIVENKRLGEILAWIKEQQDRQPRFNRVPDGPRRSSQKPGILKNRAMQITEAAKSRPKAHRRSRRRCDMEVSAAPANAPSEAAE